MATEVESYRFHYYWSACGKALTPQTLGLSFLILNANKRRIKLLTQLKCHCHTVQCHRQVETLNLYLYCVPFYSLKRTNISLLTSDDCSITIQCIVHWKSSSYTTEWRTEGSQSTINQPWNQWCWKRGKQWVWHICISSRAVLRQRK